MLFVEKHFSLLDPSRFEPDSAVNKSSLIESTRKSVISHTVISIIKKEYLSQAKPVKGK